jgi:hypothetical protein
MEFETTKKIPRIKTQDELRSIITALIEYFDREYEFIADEFIPENYLAWHIERLVMWCNNQGENIVNSYNGYKNYETWCAAMWIANDHGCTDLWQDAAIECFEETDKSKDFSERRESAIRSFSAVVRENLSNDRDVYPDNGLLMDLLNAAIDRVDWLTVASDLFDDAVQESSIPE